MKGIFTPQRVCFCGDPAIQPFKLPVIEVKEGPEVTPEEIDELVRLYKKAVKAKKLLEERLAKEDVNPTPRFIYTGDLRIIQVIWFG